MYQLAQVRGRCHQSPTPAGSLQYGQIRRYSSVFIIQRGRLPSTAQTKLARSFSMRYCCRIGGHLKGLLPTSVSAFHRFHPVGSIYSLSFFGAYLHNYAGFQLAYRRRPRRRYNASSIDLLMSVGQRWWLCVCYRIQQSSKDVAGIEGKRHKHSSDGGVLFLIDASHRYTFTSGEHSGNDAVFGPFSGTE